MSKHRLWIGFIFLGAAAIVATTYGCSDDAQSDPPEPDAGNPTRRVDSGSSSGNPSGDAANDAPPAVTYKAKVTLAATSLADAGAVTGTVDFTDNSGTVVVSATISGATPGQHALHIHEGTSCADTDAGAAMAAGAHWNPTDAGHGLPTSPTHHAGDFGNMTVDGTGNGTLMLNATGFTVAADGGVLSAIGHAVIFHQGTDDGTGTNGNAGGRAGCGIIQAQ